MRKNYRFLLSCIIVAMIGIMPILSFGQDEGTDAKMTRKEKRQLFDPYFYINLNAGLMFNHTDISNTRFLAPLDSWRLGYGGSFGWQFKPIWGIRLKATAGKLYGTTASTDDAWLQNIYSLTETDFKAKLLNYHLDLTINFSNLISGYNPDRLIDVYGILGAGYAEWESHAYDASGTEVHVLDDINMDGYHKGIFNGDRTRVWEVNTGLGAALKLSPSFDINAEWELKFPDSDYLDRFTHPGDVRNNDMYSYGSVGLTYKFGKSDPLKKMKKNYSTVTFKAEPDPLEAHGGKVAVKITGTFPDGYFSPKAAMYMEPYLVCEGIQMPMKPILLKGTDVGGEGIVISKDGGSFTYETVVDYNENCRVTELFVEPVIFVPKGDLPTDLNKDKIMQNYKKTALLDARKLADGTIITASRFIFNQTGAIVPHGYEKETILTKEATLYFEVNKYNLNWKVPLNKEDANKNKLTEMLNFISLGYKIKDINIDGWASPEGEETFNQGLSENRTKTAQTYEIDKIKGLIKAKETKLMIKDAAKDITYNLVHHGPDWNGFINTIQNSDMKDKNIILNVVNTAGTPAKKEQEIRNMIVIYPDIESKYLPPLRRAEIVVNCYQPKKTDEEMAQLSTTNPRALDEKELLYAATLSKDMKTRLDIYKSAISIFPDSYKGYANAGALEIEMNDLTAAKAHLEKAMSLNPNSGEVNNNLGIIYALEGNYPKAAELFTKAGQLGTDASYNLGVISIQKGDYTKALSLFGNKTCDYNVALVYIATKNYPPAEKQLNCAPEDAPTYYLKAILGSRTANTSMMYDNLGKAIKMNPAYKQEAKTDREFIKYFADPNFTSLVN